MGNFGPLHPVNLLCLVLPSWYSQPEKLSKHRTLFAALFRHVHLRRPEELPLSLVVGRWHFRRHLGCTSPGHNTISMPVFATGGSLNELKPST